MRILKRNLAFVLALVMALSLTVSAAGVEDYTDVNDITFDEAVDVLTEMGILEGTDGAFNPTDILTREQAAKIIAYMLLGKSAADNLNVAKAPFADVPANRWSAGYVAYCASQNIVGGYGDGNFGPKDQLTGTQFAKMLLCAVGYGVNGEFTGARWESEVNALALKLGVFDGNLGVNFSEACTREEAALYAFNALWNIDTVNYSELFGTYYAGKSVLDNEGAQTLNEALYDFDDKDDEDVFGRQGHVYVNAKNKVVTGLYGDKADATYTANTKSGTIYADLGLTETTVATVIENGERLEKGFQLKKNSTTKTAWGNGTLIEAYVDDEDVTLVVIDTYLAQVDADAEDGEVDVTVFSGPIAGGTFETAVEYAEDDYVLVTIADGDIQSMVPAEIVTGDLDAFSADSYVKLNGEKYNLAANVADGEGECFTINYNVEMAVVLDECGYAIGLYEVEEEEELDGYVWVEKAQVRDDDLFVGEAAVAKVMYLDGTGYEVLPMATKTVNKETNVQTTVKGQLKWVTVADALAAYNQHDTSIVKGFYGYYMNDDDQIVLVNLDDTKAAQVKAGTVKFEKAQKGEFGELKTLLMNSNTELVMVTEDDADTTVGYKNININETDVNALVLYNGRIIETLVVVDGETVSDDVYAYYNGGTYKNEDGTWVTLYVDGEAVSYLYSKTLEKGAYIIETEGDELTAVKNVGKAATVAAVKSLYFQTTEGAKEYFHEDVKVFDITDDGVEGSIAKNDKVVYVLDQSSKDTGLVTYIYIVGSVDKNATENDKDVVVDTDVEVTVAKAGNTVTFNFTGIEVDKDEIEIVVYNYSNGITGEYETIEITPYAATRTYEKTYDFNAQLTFKVMVNGAELLTEGPLSFVK